MTRQEKRGVTEERRPNGRRESPKRERRIGTPCQKTSLSAIAPVVPFTIPLSLSFDVDVFVLGFDSPTPRYSCSFSSPRNVRGATSSPNSSLLFGLAAPLLRPPRFPFTHSKKTPSKPRNQKTLSPQACGDCACAPPPTSAAAFRDAKKTSTSGDACWVCLGEGTRSGDGGGRSGDGGCGTDCCADERLVLPCACPRPVHAACLARWQLHSAGTPEETSCRFCQGQLPDWKGVLTPAEMRHAGWEESDDGGAAAAGPAGEAAPPGGNAAPPASSPLPASPSPSSPPRLHPRLRHPAPTMSVTFNGVVHHIVVRGGPNGYAAFVADVRRIFGIDAGHDMQLAFDCADPVTGGLVKLNGAGAYQAAVHCAAISAAKRMASWSRAQREREQQEEERRRGEEEAAAATEAALALASGGTSEDGDTAMMEEDGASVPSSAPDTPSSEGSGAPSDASSAALDAAIESALAAAASGGNGSGSGSGGEGGSRSPTSASSPPLQQQQQEVAAAASTRVTRRSAAAAAASRQAAEAAQAALAAGSSATVAPGDLRRALAEIAGGVRRLRAAAAAVVGAGGGGASGDDDGDAASTAAALREVADLIASTADASTLQQQQQAQQQQQQQQALW